VSRSYYVYYKCAAAAPAVRAAVTAMQAALATATGVRGRLLRRVDGDGTWMEVYDGVADPQAFERALAAAVADARLDALLAPGAARHLERFAAD
jgi:hypothetical protein